MSARSGRGLRLLSLIRGMGIVMRAIPIILMIIVVGTFLYAVLVLSRIGLVNQALAFLGVDLLLLAVLFLMLTRVNARTIGILQLLLGVGFFLALQAVEITTPFSSTDCFLVGSFALFVTVNFYTRREAGDFFAEVLLLSTVSTSVFFTAGLFDEAIEIARNFSPSLPTTNYYPAAVSSLFVIGSVDLFMIAIYFIRFGLPRHMGGMVSGPAGTPSTTTPGTTPPPAGRSGESQGTSSEMANALARLRDTEIFIETYRQNYLFVPLGQTTRAQANSISMLFPQLVNSLSLFLQHWTSSSSSGPDSVRTDLDIVLTRTGKLDISQLGSIMTRMNRLDLALPVIWRIRDYVEDFRAKVRRQGWDDYDESFRLLDMNVLGTIDHLSNERESLTRLVDRVNLYYQTKLSRDNYRLQVIIVALAIVAVVAPFGPSILKLLGW
jgi:hypothetical protein